MLSHQRQCRDRHHIQHIADDRDRPILSRLVRDLSKQITHGVTDQFPQSGEESDRTGGSAHDRQISAPDAGSTFMGHI